VSALVLRLEQTLILNFFLKSFSAGCYAQWNQKNGDCPNCRKNVQDVHIHHLLKSLVRTQKKNLFEVLTFCEKADDFLKVHPNEDRTDAEKKDMDAKGSAMLAKSKSS
jgi:hypothetical protein